MKKFFVLFLAFSICISLFSACAGSSDNNQSGESNAEHGGTDDVSSDNSVANSGNGGNGEKPEYPKDILEGLPYTITCLDKYTQEVAEYEFNDEGKLNDGLYRSEADLESEANEEMCVKFENTSKYNFVITFESNGSYDGYRLILHDCDFYLSILKIEVGDDLDDMTEIEFEEDTEKLPNMHLDYYANFDITTIEKVRITLTTGTSVSTSFDEISILGFPKGEADKWLKTDESEPETSVPQGGKTDSRFVGTWGADDPEIVEKGGSDYKVVITFASDGTGSYSQAGMELPMTWYVSDDLLYMNVAIVGPLEKSYSFKNGRLYLPDEDGRTTEFVKL